MIFYHKSDKSVFCCKSLTFEQTEKVKNTFKYIFENGISTNKWIQLYFITNL